MRTYWLKSIIGIAVLMNCFPVHAQDLPALTTKLKNLQGNDTLRVAVLVEAGVASGESKASSESEKFQLSIARDPNGLRLMILGVIADTRLFREFSLFRASEIIDYAPSLVNELAGMELVENHVDSREGVPCTRWVLQANETRSQSGATAKIHKTVELWLDANGYPMAASFTTQAESKMLFVKMTRESKREQRYKRVGDHLVLTLDKTEEMDRGNRSRETKRTVTTIAQIAHRPTP